MTDRDGILGVMGFNVEYYDEEGGKGVIVTHDSIPGLFLGGADLNVAMRDAV